MKLALSQGGAVSAHSLAVIATGASRRNGRGGEHFHSSRGSGRAAVALAKQARFPKANLLAALGPEVSPISALLV